MYKSSPATETTTIDDTNDKVAASPTKLQALPAKQTTKNQRQMNNITSTQQVQASPMKKTPQNDKMPAFCQNLTDLLGRHIQVAPPAPESGSVLCFLMSHSKHHTSRVANVLHTWGRKCDKILVASNKVEDWHDDKISFLKLQAPATYKGLWLRLQETAQYIMEHYPNFDWYFKVDDDTYVIIENLRHLLEQNRRDDEPLLMGRRLINPDPVQKWLEDPMWFDNDRNKDFGQRFLERFSNDTTILFAHGGPGYVMNRRYLELFVEASRSSDNILGDGGEQDPPEDMAHAAVMMYHGINPFNVSVEEGEYFHPEPPDTIYRMGPNSGHFMLRFSETPIRRGLACCARYSISFHHITKMKRLEKIVYQCPR